jgi:hypothetical protein
MRKKYDENPKSFLARIWRWHITWCPGWKQYLKSLNDDRRQLIAKEYNLKIGD